MSATFQFEGLEDLIASLRTLPEDLANEAGAIVLDRAERAKQDIETSYPDRTGDLRKGMQVTRANAGKYGAGVYVKNTSKLAYIYENGTQARHTSLGANRGSMPPGHVFIPVMIRQRLAMYGDLADLMTRHGLAVSGDA